MGTIASHAQLVRLGLLMGVSTERQGRVLVSYGSPIVKSDSVFTPPPSKLKCPFKSETKHKHIHLPSSVQQYKIMFSLI